MNRVAIVKANKDLKTCSTMENFSIEADNLQEWKCTYSPQNNVRYKNSYNFTVNIPVNYPFGTPQIIFTTPIYHPNIDKDTGKMCMGILAGWEPKYSLGVVFENIVSHFLEPDLGNPVNQDAAKNWENIQVFLTFEASHA